MSIYSVLKKYWGFSDFRPLQEDIIQSVIAGNDTLALMPTGGGKSICFQVPALLKPGICIVVSPLIALMKDQVTILSNKGIPALAIIAGMGKREIDILLDNCIFGEIKFLYLSPERLLAEIVRERIRHMNVNLIAVDEAHCISQWGYDFRPPYLHIAQLRELHPEVPVIALTATATQRVVDDIQEKLTFKKAFVFRKSFERKNLSYVVLNPDNKLGKLITIVNKVSGSGIVYVRNRSKTEEIARYLNTHKISASFYHAGLPTSLRTERQSDWKEGRTRIIVATNAFGMGIDKADVRLVIHLDLPDSLEAYYQEAGRAGRDEKKAYAVLLYKEEDKLQLIKKLAQSCLSIEEVKQVYHLLGNYYQLAYGAGEGLCLDFDLAEFCTRFKLEIIKTLHVLKYLAREEYISLTESVFIPSRIQIIVTHEELYRFQIEQPAYDYFIKMILRLYGGLFDRFIPIKENEMAKRIGLSKAEVVQHLTKLQAIALIHYIPQTDKPQLQWLKPRMDKQHVILDRKYMQAHYQIQKQQIESVITYAESQLCRSKQLLRYFDDAEAVNCGVCDYCLDEKKRAQQSDISDEIIKHLLHLLASGQKMLEELVTGIPIGTDDEKLKAIRFLVDAGKIGSNGGLMVLK